MNILLSVKTSRRRRRRLSCHPRGRLPVSRTLLIRHRRPSSVILFTVAVYHPACTVQEPFYNVYMVTLPPVYFSSILFAHCFHIHVHVFFSGWFLHFLAQLCNSMAAARFKRHRFFSTKFNPRTLRWFTQLPVSWLHWESPPVGHCLPHLSLSGRAT